MNSRSPVTLRLDHGGIAVAESIHDPEFRMDPQVDPYHEIVVIARGRVQARIAGETTTELITGAILPIPAGTPHSFRDVEPSTLLLLAVDPRLMEASPDRLALWTGFCQTAPKGAVLPPGPRERIYLLFRNRMAEKEAPNTAAARLAATNDLDGLLLAVNGTMESEAPPGGRDRVRRFIDELRSRCHEEWDLPKAARETALSSRRLAAYIREETGESFISILQIYRIDAVRNLLSSGGHTIAAAAFWCGFRDLSHFYRVFRKITGMSPGAWLRENES